MNKSQAIATLRQLVAEVMQEHRDPECAAYNECDQPGQTCMWCSMAQEALDATAVEEAFVGKVTTVNLASMPCMTGGGPAYTTKPYPIYCQGCQYLSETGDCRCKSPTRTFAATEHTCPYYAKEEKPNDAG